MSSFRNSGVEGVYVLGLNYMVDERGYFARTWCKQTFEELGLDIQLIQSSISYNIKKGILRGMHFQTKPFEEVKCVSCVCGSIYDVVIDLRPESKTYLKWTGIKLNSHFAEILYIPKGCAHGFQTLENNTTVSYHISQVYEPEYARGVRWNDPTFNIPWPITNPIMSEKDRTWPLLNVS
jgi:dTDP-4-dehydrorhamnose 3,5-epimerase